VIHRSSCDGPLTFLPSVGQSATHALVLAQLICSGVRRGMHAFIVPIRSLQDHTPLPGKPSGSLMDPFLEVVTPRFPILRPQEIHGKNWDMSSLVQEASGWTDLVPTSWVTLLSAQNLPDPNTGAVTPESQGAVSWNVCGTRTQASTQLMGVLVSISF
jgi:hypothetical protein